MQLDIHSEFLLPVIASFTASFKTPISLEGFKLKSSINFFSRNWWLEYPYFVAFFHFHDFLANDFEIVMVFLEFR